MNDEIIIKVEDPTEMEDVHRTNSSFHRPVPPWVIIGGIFVLTLLLQFFYIFFRENLIERLKDLWYPRDYLNENARLELYTVVILFIGAFGALLSFIAALFLNYEKNKQVPVLRGFLRCTWEFRYLAFPAAFLFILSITMSGFPYGIHAELLKYGILYPTDSIYFFTVGTIMSFLLLLYVFLFSFSLKEILIEGLLTSFMQNTFFGKLLLFIRRRILIRHEQRLSVKESRFSVLLTYAGYAVHVFFLTVCLNNLWRDELFFFLLCFISFSLYQQIQRRQVRKRILYLEEELEKKIQGHFDLPIREDLKELSHVASNVNRISDGLKRAIAEETKSERMKTELIANVSHDLKTPLTGIINYADLIVKNDTTLEQKNEYATVIYEKSIRLKTLIEDLFEISKTASGDIILHKENLDIIRLLHQSVGEMEPKLSERELQIISSVPTDTILCYLDGQRTYRIFENILSNIAKYSLRGTRVYVDVFRQDRNINFVFKNTSNYPMNFHPDELYERFFRGDRSRSQEGSGLGLGIAKNLIELQGGSMAIVVDGDLFKVTLTFPTAASPMISEETTVSPSEPLKLS